MSSTRENVAVGQEVLVKVCGRVIVARVEEILPDGWMVKSIASGKTFKTRKLHEQVEAQVAGSEQVEAQVAEPAPETQVAGSEQVEAQVAEPETESAAEPAQDGVPTTEQDGALTIEQGGAPTTEQGQHEAPPTRKMSLLDAAIAILKADARPMSTREMVKLAIERGLWVQTSCKTPEQSLYGAIFREIKVAERPRIRKSEKKGAFEYAG